MASRDVCTGTLTVVQHFGSGLNLNVHFHTVAFDGVFSRTPAGALTFPPAGPPSDAEVAKVLGAFCPAFCAFPYWRVGLCKTQSGYRGVNVSLLN